MYNLGFPELGFIAFIVAVLGFVVWMLISVWRNTAHGRIAKIIWTAALITTGPFAALYYFATVFLKRKDTLTANT